MTRQRKIPRERTCLTTVGVPIACTQQLPFYPKINDRMATPFFLNVSDILMN